MNSQQLGDKDLMMKQPQRFNSSMNIDINEKQKREKIDLRGDGNLANIKENDVEQEESGLHAMELPDKPSYFSMFDDEEIDSEDEMVPGENNYIEIDCLPINPVVPDVVEAAPEEEKKEVPAATIEEEKKEVSAADDRSSQYKGSLDGEKEVK